MRKSGLINWLWCLAAAALCAAGPALGQYTEWENFTNGDNISAVACDANYAWVGTSGGLVRVRLADNQTTFYNKVTSQLPLNYITALAVGAGGNVWIGTQGAGLVKFDGNSAWTRYTMASSGLPSDLVHALAVDAQGHVWIGTDNGVAEFTGAAWTVHTTGNSALPNDIIWSMAVAPNGTVWAGTDYGMAKYTGGIWTAYVRVTNQLPNNFVMALAADAQSTIWIGTRSGAARLDTTGTWTVYKAPRFDVKIYAGADSLWQAPHEAAGFNKKGNGGIFYYDQNGSGSWDANELLWTEQTGDTLFDSLDQIVTGATTTPLDSLKDSLELQANVLFYDANNDSQYSADEEIWCDNMNLTQFDDPALSGIPNNNILAVKTKPNGDVCFGTKLGVAVISGSSWSSYNSVSSQLPYNEVSALGLDAANNLWVGTTRGGLAKFTGAAWTMVTTSNSGLPGNAVRSFALDDSSAVWMGTLGTGLMRLKTITIGPGMTISVAHVFNTANSPLLSNDINALAADTHNVVWVAAGDFTVGNLAKIQDSMVATYDVDNSDLPGHNVRSLLLDRHDTLWVGTGGNQGSTGDEGGLGRFNGTNPWVYYDLNNSGLVKNEISTVAEDKDGALWMGVTEAYMASGVGLARFDRAGGWASYQTVNSGLPNDYVTCILVDTAGTKWIATLGGGLARLHDSTWTVYDTSNSPLPHNKLNTLALDHAGNVWIGTAGGLAVFDKTTTWTVYTTENSGLEDNNILGLYVDKNNRKWIGTTGGATVCSTCAGGVGIRDQWAGRPAAELNTVLRVRPNPMTGATNVELMLAKPGRVQAAVYSLSNQPVRVLADRVMTAGASTLTWDGRDGQGARVDAGIYIVRLRVDGRTFAQRIIVAR
jgi:ligand-binding sensor domain-containing protein